MNKDSRRTPVNSNYETCEECRVSLLIYLDRVHPDDVSKILQLEPTKKIL